MMHPSALGVVLAILRCFMLEIEIVDSCRDATCSDASDELCQNTGAHQKRAVDLNGTKFTLSIGLVTTVDAGTGFLVVPHFGNQP